jgi:solute carrier family 35 (UDP-galactose transporter), member B1
MLLSVFVYNHKLTPGQWMGATIVFAGISVEAYVKRKGDHQTLFFVETHPDLSFL